MKKSAIATAVAMSMGMGGAHAANMSSATFTMYGPDGLLVSNTCGGSGNCPNGVDPTLTGTIGNGVWNVASSETFFGANWSSKSGTTFGVGTYTFDTNKGGTSGPLYSSIVVGPNQVGGHILFDWGPANSTTSCGVAECSLDVVNVWNLSVAAGVTTYTSPDVSLNRSNSAQTASTVIGPNGILGAPLQDSASFLNFEPNFDFTVSSTIPVPAAVWLFGSGLLGLVGVARRKKSA